MRLAAVLLCALLAFPAAAHEFFLGDLQIIHPSIPATPMGATRASVYMAIANDGAEPERLMGIETPFGPVTFLRPIEGDGDRMEPLAWIDIAPGDVVLLARGEMRGLVGNVSRPLFEGGQLPGAMIFQKLGRFEMFFLIDPLEEIEEPPAADQAAAAPQERAAEIIAISAALRGALGEPEAMIAPIVLQGEVALAGWTQGGEGARAFLRRSEKGEWRVLLWSGASLTLQSTLTSLGVGRRIGDLLRAELHAAEAALGPSFTARFDAFPGTAVVEAAP